MDRAYKAHGVEATYFAFALLLVLAGEGFCLLVGLYDRRARTDKFPLGACVIAMVYYVPILVIEKAEQGASIKLIFAATAIAAAYGALRFVVLRRDNIDALKRRLSIMEGRVRPVEYSLVETWTLEDRREAIEQEANNTYFFRIAGMIGREIKWREEKMAWHAVCAALMAGAMIFALGILTVKLQCLWQPLLIVCGTAAVFWMSAYLLQAMIYAPSRIPDGTEV